MEPDVVLDAPQGAWERCQGPEVKYAATVSLRAAYRQACRDAEGTERIPWVLARRVEGPGRTSPWCIALAAADCPRLLSWLLPGEARLLPGAAWLLPDGSWRAPDEARRPSGAVWRVPGQAHRPPRGVWRVSDLGDEVPLVTPWRGLEDGAGVVRWRGVDQLMLAMWWQDVAPSGDAG